ncbi:hypothetical protein HAX54_044809 [Datura stramonium]|uniref:Uncharacterized protein n=1 Tax=Datura stramonium TaxID=4076 RepID=A0ABS8WJY0_DATST|nr:hypothetical protein [Datura stramonium]
MPIGPSHLLCLNPLCFINNIISKYEGHLRAVPVLPICEAEKTPPILHVVFLPSPAETHAIGSKPIILPSSSNLPPVCMRLIKSEIGWISERGQDVNMTVYLLQCGSLDDAHVGHSSSPLKNSQPGALILAKRRMGTVEGLEVVLRDALLWDESRVVHFGWGA